MRFELMSGSVPLSCPCPLDDTTFNLQTYLDYCDNTIKVYKLPSTNLVAAKLLKFVRPLGFEPRTPALVLCISYDLMSIQYSNTRCSLQC